MKVRAEVSATRERPVAWEGRSHQRVDVAVKLTIEASRGDAVVGAINAVMEGARKTAVESIRAGA